MASMLFKAIKVEKQYNDYSKKLVHLLEREKRRKDENEIIELLTVLLEYFDRQHDTFGKADPVDMLHFLMNENAMKITQLAKYLRIDEELLSDILNYRLGFPKPIARKLADRFKLRQEAFSTQYVLVNAVPLTTYSP